MFKSTEDDLARERLTKFVIGEDIPSGDRIVISSEGFTCPPPTLLAPRPTPPNGGRRDIWT